MLNHKARQVHSPNRSSRGGAEVEWVVLHYITLPPGRFGTGDVERLFTNALDPAADPYFAQIAGLKVSAHFFIDRAGALTQFVDTGEAAWHAGVSSWGGREGVNLFSIGIELEGDEHTPFEDAQYQALAGLLSWIREVHPGVLPGHVVGHQHVSPGRKIDPGPCFDWARLAGLTGAVSLPGKQPVPEGRERPPEQ